MIHMKCQAFITLQKEINSSTCIVLCKYYDLHLNFKGLGRFCHDVV